MPATATLNAGECSDLAGPYRLAESPDLGARALGTEMAQYAGNEESHETACGVADALGSVLANSYMLMTTTQACHWNGTGAGLFGLDKLTEDQFTELFHAIDAIADRLCEIGGHAPASLAGMFAHATVFDADGAGEPCGSHAAARMLAEAHEAVAVVALQAATLAEHEADQTTHGMLVTRVAAHEKAARLLRSHLA